MINDGVRREICGRRISDYVQLPAWGTRGGVLIAWQEKRFKKIAHAHIEYCLTITLRDTLFGNNFLFTGVYGPNSSVTQGTFFEEIREAITHANMPWIVCGDFNTTLDVTE